MFVLSQLDLREVLSFKDKTSSHGFLAVREAKTNTVDAGFVAWYNLSTGIKCFYSFPFTPSKYRLLPLSETAVATDRSDFGWLLAYIQLCCFRPNQCREARHLPVEPLCVVRASSYIQNFLLIAQDCHECCLCLWSLPSGQALPLVNRILLVRQPAGGAGSWVSELEGTRKLALSPFAFISAFLEASGYYYVCPPQDVGACKQSGQIVRCRCRLGSRPPPFLSALWLPLPRSCRKPWLFKLRVQVCFCCESWTDSS